MTKVGLLPLVLLVGVAVSVGDIAGLLMVLVVGALTARRFLHSQVRQQLDRQAVEQELEQARELQQHVLIPEPVNSLMFMTDGVAEATNAAKELFGFERTREISGQSAAAIVEQARSFGQEDDITVLGVEFAGATA